MSSLGRYGSMAENLLRRQGWTEGQGLGKRGQGVPEPIKASLKFDSAGVGHDPAKEFTNHWWDVAFNRAAMNIQVEEDEEEGGVKVKSDKKWTKKERSERKRKEKNSLYSQFVKGATLSDGKMEANEEDDDGSTEDLVEEKAKERQLNRLTDEQLFEACGGMTAHKGARHGHKMSGKQARIEAMEAKLLAEMKPKVRERKKEEPQSTKEKKRKRKREKEKKKKKAKIDKE